MTPLVKSQRERMRSWKRRTTRMGTAMERTAASHDSMAQLR
jgi:hypothetical protein